MIKVLICDRHGDQGTAIVRIIISLFLFILAVVILFASGCGNNNSPIEERRNMTDSNATLSGSNTAAGSETATFALG